MTTFAALIPALAGLLLAIAMITASVIAHRGKAFWGTWMMLIGSIGSTVGSLVAIFGTYLMMTSISASITSSSSSSSSTADSMALYGMMTGIGSLISLGSLLAFVVGFLGLAVRYGAVNKRVHELETITASLVSERDQPSNPR